MYMRIPVSWRNLSFSVLTQDTSSDVAGADERRCQRDQGRLAGSPSKSMDPLGNIHGLHRPFTRVEANYIGEPLIH